MILRSVPHTGTMFTEQIMEAMGFNGGFVHVWRGDEYWQPLNGERMVVPLRDPALSIITSLNRGEESHADKFQRIAGYREDPNVHFFRVDCPTDERVERLTALADFCDRECPETDWQPVNETGHDCRKGRHNGLKRTYQAGTMPIAVKPHVEVVREDAGVMELLTDHGYDLFWMEESDGDN